MNRVKKIFAVIFAIMAVLLMSTAVWAYSGNGTEDFPYVVTTFDELKTCMEKGGYVELGADISETFDSEHYSDIKIKVTSETHLDFCSYNVNTHVTTDNGQIVSLFIVSGTTLYIDDSGIEGGVYLKCTSMGKTSQNEVVWCNHNGTLVVNGGNLINESGSVIVGQSNEGAFPKVIINGGYLYSMGTEGYGITMCFDITINGGILKSDGRPFCDWSPGMFGYDGTLKINGGEIGGIYIYPKSVQPQIKNCIIHGAAQINASYKIDYAFSYYHPTVIVDGEEKSYEELATLNILKGTDIIVSMPDTGETKCTFNNDVTPRAGKSVSFPTVPDDAKYRITSAKWLNTSAEEVTEFSADGGSYYLMVDAEIIDTENEKFSSTYPVLSETTGAYSVTKSEYTSAKTKLSATFKFVMQPVITQQPQDVTVYKSGDEARFYVTAYNADSYEWFLADKNGNIKSWDDAKSSGLISSSSYGMKGGLLILYPTSADINEYRVYCKVTFNNKTVKSKNAVIYWQKYNVDFNAGSGGSGEMKAMTAYGGTPFVLPECTFTKTGSEFFYKWNINGTYYPAGSEVIINDDTTATAVWKNCMLRYYIYDKTSGTDKLIQSLIPYGTEHILLDYSYYAKDLPDHKKFDHWRIYGKDYNAGDTITVTEDNMALYNSQETLAVIIRPQYVDCWIVTLDADNGSSETVEIRVIKGDKLTLPECTFDAPTGATFYGWSIGEEVYSEKEEISITKDTTVKALWAVSSGTAGDNCTWTFDPATGTLTVSGSGRMTAYTKDNRPPWYDLKNKIKKVVIENGVTYVGSWAFEGCTQLTEAILADSILSIGPSSFKDTGLTGINIPQKTQIIANDAFVNTHMTYIIVPKSVTKLNSSYSVGYNCDTSTSPWTYTRVDGFVVCGYADGAAKTYADDNGFDFIQLGNVNNDAEHIVDEADAALLLKYLSGSAELEFKQTVAARVTDSLKDEPDMLDVVWILNNKTPA